MNLMIVLVPVLLLSMVFVHTTVIDLNFPSASSSTEAVSSEDVHLEVRIESDALVVADQRGVIKRVPMTDGVHDFDALGELMFNVKRRFPEKRDATILLAPETDYQTLVFVMDSVRARRSDAGNEVELFPELSLGDAPGGSS